MKKMFKLTIYLFIVLVTVQANTTVQADTDNIITPETEPPPNLVLAQNMKDNVITIMEDNAEMSTIYQLGGECFTPSDQGYIHLLTFSPSKEKNQPRIGKESELFKTLLSSSEDEVFDTYNGKFYYISYVNATSPHCDRCHDFREPINEFSKIGAVSIITPLIE